MFPYPVPIQAEMHGAQRCQPIELYRQNCLNDRGIVELWQVRWPLNHNKHRVEKNTTISVFNEFPTICNYFHDPHVARILAGSRTGTRLLNQRSAVHGFLFWRDDDGSGYAVSRLELQQADALSGAAGFANGG